METLTRKQARGLVLARAGLLAPALTGMPARGAGAGRRARAAAQRVVERFGYLQLDSVSVSGARSHGIVLLSRVLGMRPEVAEQLLEPGAPLFEYWGHEASWIPLDLYSEFEWRRQAYREHPWWGDVLGDHRDLARTTLRRIQDDGAVRSSDLPGDGVSLGQWEWAGPTRKVLSALWSSGELAVSRRVNFQREFDLTERIIPAHLRERRPRLEESLPVLLLRALSGHGWASTGTLAATYRLANLQPRIKAAMNQLLEAGQVVQCCVGSGPRRRAGWARPADLELVGDLDRLRPRRDRGVLLSPFDPVVWDRARTAWLFDFEAVLEIFKPRPKRVYGYYCLPVLAADRFVARVDLKADRPAGRLRVLACHYEASPPSAVERRATRTALDRFSAALELDWAGRT